MRAVLYDRFGPPDVLRVAETDTPVPGPGEVRVTVRAASLNPLDWKIRDGHLKLLPILARPPRITGCDLAGDVVEIGGGSAARHVGERVFGSLSPFAASGSCAEYAVIEVHRIAAIPDGVDYEAAACLPIAGGTAVQALTEDAQLRAGQRVLILGAAGGVGHFAVQLAKQRKLYVVATCGPANVAWVKSLGADEVVDYTRDDILRRDDRFDLVFDVANVLDALHARALLVRGGLYLGTAGSMSAAVGTGIAGLLGPLTHIRAKNLVLRGGSASLRHLADLARSRVLAPHIEQRVGFDGVAQAQAAMAAGHGRGKIVVIP